MDGLSSLGHQQDFGSPASPSARRQSLFDNSNNGGGAFDTKHNQHHSNGEGFFAWGGEGGTGSKRNSTNMGNPASSDDIFATAAAMRESEVNKQLGGYGYNLSFVHHKNRAAHSKPYFFASPVGAPFPSYNTNPMPNFPARWTQIPGAHPPCENLLAPRIRLAPKELTAEKRSQMEKMRYTAELEYAANKNTNNGDNKNVEETNQGEGSNVQLQSLNLAYQSLGDPYQYEAFVTFMDLNRNVKILNLNDNELEDITDLHLDTVVRLHLSRNNFVSFEGIPELLNCEELFLTENFLSGFSAINSSKFPKLRVLNVEHNPITMMQEYRQKLKKAIPTLMYVDGLRV